MADTVVLTPVSVRSNRLTYNAESTGLEAAPSATGTRTNAQLLADFISLWQTLYGMANTAYTRSPLYQLLLAAYPSEAALDAATLAGGSGLPPNGGGVRIIIRPLAGFGPQALFTNMPASFLMWIAASLTLAGGSNIAPLLKIQGPPGMNTTPTATPWNCYMDIEYGWSGKGA